MLNPDGVANGNHRCSLAGCDLNRRYLRTSPSLHPTVYHTKALLEHLNANGHRPVLYCDFHGHSRKKMIFMYGCHQSTRAQPRNPPSDFPQLLGEVAPGFSAKSCKFSVTADKESCGRVVVWRKFGISRSYTLESTYCGFDRGPYKGMQVNFFFVDHPNRIPLVYLTHDRTACR